VNIETTHSGYAGRSLIERIEARLDKRRKAFSDTKSERDKGRCEGIAIALSVLRSSSMAEEIARSSERMSQ
jgi:hypothetical protein